MTFKPDFKTHVLGGLAVLAFSLVAAAALLIGLRLQPLTVVILVAGIVAGLAVEGTQAHDNRLAKAAGLPLPHEVSVRDLFNSALPCLVGAAIMELAARHGWLPVLG